MRSGKRQLWGLILLVWLGALCAMSLDQRAVSAQAAATDTPTSTSSPTTTSTGTATLTLTVTNTPTPTVTSTGTQNPNATYTPFAPGHIVISEFRTRGPAGDNDEFIELFNPTGAAINIGGWIIRDSQSCAQTPVRNRATISSNTVLEAGQHVLLASNANSTVNGPDMTFAPGIADDGGLALLDLSNNVIDQVGMCISTAYREGTNLTPLAGDSNQSYERRPGGATACYDTGNNAGDFVRISPSNPQNKTSPITRCSGVPIATPTRTATRTPTRTATRAPTAIPGFVVINEFLPHPLSDWNQDGTIDVGDEFVELMNLSTVSVNIANWKLDNGANTTQFVLPNVTMLPRQILVFFRFETSLPLPDGGGSVRLVKPDGRTADIFNYPPVEAGDVSWCRLLSGTGFLTFTCPPTPGRPNVALAALTATPGPTSTPGGLSNCGLADTVPEPIRLAECNGSGANIWEAAPGESIWVPTRWKWAAIIE